MIAMSASGTVFRENGQFQSAGYRVIGSSTTVKFRSVTVSVVGAAISPWKFNTIGKDNESYPFNTAAAKPSTAPELCTDNWLKDPLAPPSAQPEMEASATAPLRCTSSVLPQLTVKVKPVS